MSDNCIEVTDEMLDAGVFVHLKNDPDSYVEDRRELVMCIYTAMEAKRREGK